jgi:hypothetical protein
MKTIAKLSVQEYERIVGTGVFDGKNRRRVELIRGELRELSPIGAAHNQGAKRGRNFFLKRAASPLSSSTSMIRNVTFAS